MALLEAQTARADMDEKDGHRVDYSPAAQDPAFEVTWEEDDAENPQRYPLWYKCFIVGSTSFSTTNM